MEHFGIIYKATFSNGKCYIGQTVASLNTRVQSHIKAIKSGRENQVFHRAIIKYGEDDITWEIIDYADSIEELNEKEIYWIKFYNSYVHFENSNGYNMTLGGNSTIGWIPSEETKKKISEANKGKLAGDKNPQYGKTGKDSQWWQRKHTEEEKIKISIANKGRVFTEKHRRNISNSNKGKRKGIPNTEEHNRKISESKKGHEVTEKTKKKLSEANRGKRSPFAKLKESDVIEIIYKLIDKSKNISLAEEYNVSKDIIGNIKNNKSWKHVLPELRTQLIKKNKKRKNKNNGN
jgi:group I intron endonuclease